MPLLLLAGAWDGDLFLRAEHHGREVRRRRWLLRPRIELRMERRVATYRAPAGAHSTDLSPAGVSLDIQVFATNGNPIERVRRNLVENQVRRLRFAAQPEITPTRFEVEVSQRVMQLDGEPWASFDVPIDDHPTPFDLQEVGSETWVAVAIVDQHVAALVGSPFERDGLALTHADPIAVPQTRAG